MMEMAQGQGSFEFIRKRTDHGNKLAKMLMENPKLSRHRDFTCGYTGLHWACKHGNLDMVKLLAGTYQASVNVKSHGGYTPLHLAAQHNHQEVFDLLVQVGNYIW